MLYQMGLCMGSIWWISLNDPWSAELWAVTAFTVAACLNKKHLKNVGPIRHNEPPHAHSADVASGTVARRLRIDIGDNVWQGTAMAPLNGPNNTLRIDQ